MTEKQSSTEASELRAWYKRLLDNVVSEMLRAGAVSGAAVEAAPIWVVPQQILIAQVWGAGQKSNFIWTIAGDGAILDHIAGSVAATPRDAARHFALKWQMDAEQLRRVAQRKTASARDAKQIAAYADRIVECSERLYELAGRDDVWGNELPG
jgi:hypothetical protein